MLLSLGFRIVNANFFFFDFLVSFINDLYKVPPSFINDFNLCNYCKVTKKDMAPDVGYTSLTAESVRKIAELTEKGYDRPEIASEIGYSEKTVYLRQKEMLFV